MAPFTTIVRSKGQITIPAAVRRALALKEGDAIAILLEDGHARLVPTGSVVARTAGALKGGGPRLAEAEERAAFERAVAEEVAASMEE